VVGRPVTPARISTADVVDASVALVAARPGVRTLYTSDPDDYSVTRPVIRIGMLLV